MWALMHFIDNKNSLLETMKWNLIFLAWVIGICTLGLPQAHYLSRWSVLCSCILLGIALLIGYAKQYFLQLKNSQILIHILIALAAFFAAVSFADHQLQQRLSLRQTQVHQAEVVVYVDRMSVLNKDNKQQILQVWDASHQQMVHWLARIPAKQPELQLGQYYRLTGQVRPAHGYAIKGGFDQEKWFLQQNLMASFQVKQFELLNKSQALTQSSTSFVQRHRGFLQASRLWIEQKRLNCRNWLMQSPLRHRGLLLALLTGDESLLDDITQQQFQNLGIKHLLAISGPHVLVFAMLLCLVLHHLIARFCPELYLRMPKQLLLSLPFLIGIWVYCGFVGFEIPALRTLLMSSLIVLAMWCQRRLSVFTTLLASAVLMLLFDPFSMLSVGFWLSYGACFILLRVYQTVQQQPQQVLLGHFQQCRYYLRLLFESQGKIFIALLPLVMLFFQQLSWLAPLANIIAIPLIGVVIVPLNILATCVWLLSPSLALPLYHVADAAISILLVSLGTLQSAIPVEVQQLHFTPLQIAVLTLVIVMLFLPKGTVPKVWLVLGCLPVVLPVHETQPFEFNVLDVGQGQAVHIRDQNKQILIDTGGTRDEQKFSLADRVLLPYFSSRGISSLDQVILSHLDQDHSGAFPRLNEKMPVKQLFGSQRPQGNLPSFDYCHAGQRWIGKNIEMQVLSPQEDDLANAEYQQNELSCVIYLSYKHQQAKTHFLIMGDAGTQTEQFLLQKYPDLAVDVLVLGHHGSRFSSSPEFLQRLKPKIAIASAGWHNRYGHPSREVQQRLQQAQIPLLNTAEQGSLYFTVTDEGSLNYVAARNARLWLHP